MLEKQIKKMTMLDMALTKLAVAALILFLITIWPAAMELAQSINTLYFLAVGVIATAIVLFRIFK